MENLAQYVPRWAELFGDKTAVSISQETISYKALEEKSNRLANLMLESGLHPGDRVGIYLTKSIEAVISIYATLKARGVFVPLDPLAPVDRIEYIMNDCVIRFLVTKQERLAHLGPRLENRNDVLHTVFLFDESRPENNVCHVANRADMEQQSGLLPEDIISQYNRYDNAYILYTSGSTGLPKGVTLSHLNGMCYIDWAVKEMELSSDDIFSNHAPFQFDLSVFDLFAPANVGGTLVLIPDKVKAFGGALIKYLVSQKITIWYSVPLALIKMIESDAFHQMRNSSLRTILFAGEVFHLRYLRRLYQMLPEAAYYNLYGPTESNVCTYYKVKENDLENDELPSLPIGRPCTYAYLFTIDREGRVTDLVNGEKGELCIAGDSVMSEYWNNVEKTAEAFIQIPADMGVDGVAYRSGDIVRKDDQGNYLYVGRKDRMVKCKGYRIELGEIEHVIRQINPVQEAAVVATEHNVYENKIVAFLSLNQNNDINETAIWQYCKQKLPHYMIPEHVYFLDEIPRTSTEKIDYARLKGTTGQYAK